MKTIMNAVIFAFREILIWKTMRYALITGFLVSAVWIGLGFFFWESILSVTSRILEMVPFSMVRSNGAWMLSTFLWLQMVLLTFSLVFAFFGNLILRSVSEEKYTSFSMIVAGASALFWGIIWYLKGAYIYHQFLQLLTWLPFQTVEQGIAFFIGFYLIYNAIIITLLFIASMFSEPLIVSVEKRHFKEDDVVRDHVFSVVGYTLKDSLIFIGLSIIALPLLFIPILNIIIQIALWIWLIKDTISYDAAALSFEKVDREAHKEHKIAIWFISLFTALFNFIPILNMFGPYFGEIAMFHYMKNIAKEN